MTEPKLGYFSPSTKERNGSVMWTRPDGFLVEITHTATNDFPCKIDDAEPRGEVVGWASGMMDYSNDPRVQRDLPGHGFGPKP